MTNPSSGLRPGSTWHQQFLVTDQEINFWKTNDGEGKPVFKLIPFKDIDSIHNWSQKYHSVFEERAGFRSDCFIGTQDNTQTRLMNSNNRNLMYKGNQM